jgi:hypothetical protein
VEISKMEMLVKKNKRREEMRIGKEKGELLSPIP